MKKNYMTPCAQMEIIASSDVITLSWGAGEGKEKALWLEEIENQKRDMTWTW